MWWKLTLLPSYFHDIVSWSVCFFSDQLGCTSQMDGITVRSPASRWLRSTIDSTDTESSRTRPERHGSAPGVSAVAVCHASTWLNNRKNRGAVVTPNEVMLKVVPNAECWEASPPLKPSGRRPARSPVLWCYILEAEVLHFIGTDGVLCLTRCCLGTRYGLENH